MKSSEQQAISNGKAQDGNGKMQEKIKSEDASNFPRAEK